MQTRMNPDDVAWEQAEEISENWLAQFLQHDVLRPIGTFMLDHNGGIGTEFAILRKGSYNISLRLKDEHVASIIRLSQPGAVFFPEEKVINEVAVMRFLIDKTPIPIPFIQLSGTKKESPLELSPFIIMDYIEHDTKMYDALNTPRCPIEERGILNPTIDQDRLEVLYGQLAGILLQLSAPSLPRIGSLNQIDDFT
ncbi:phosphotransferase family protein [Penicillium verhagenii]|uniref:phosphotransferase family protein n=1 Tax=Penicillium verhagenii TaxID=1562060 RepID=UPI0025458E71|nr:phosphotransferase family protein [Penicillium verhagenii]KAJ5936990.1 phosphotransferase family protein [Penicillium verhagenii]